MNDSLPSDGHFVLWAALAEGAIGAVAVLLAWCLEVPLWSGWRVDLASAATGLAAACPLLVVMWLVMRWPVGPFRELKMLVDEFVVPLFRAGSLADFALISLVAGVGEELLFRGVVQRGLAASWGPWVACGLAALLFGLCHALNLGYCLLATAIGAYLGWLERATGNLLAPIIAHAVYDFLALIYLIRIRHHQPSQH
ncbi:MAG TPA: CPBP family intramembrane glutamic endopeptidase [Pirellulales bacterium]|nr:CPBP family intramembrane glutamic endopeptidase [Pirellulales bacterium]